MSNHNKETEARCFHCYRHYVEGTAAWALYVMRMGRKVTNPKHDPRVYHLPEGGMIHVNGIKSIATNQWIDYWCIDIPDGWKIYEEPKPEPEPLLADAKVGDLCRLRNGGYTQIESVKRRSGKTWYDRTDRYTSYPDGRLFKGENNEPDIIATEPLATEGTAEWAWQQMLLGNRVWNPELDLHKAKRTMSQVLSIYYIDGGNIMVRNLSGERSVLGVQKDSYWAVYAESTGWQLYEEPEPYAAGGWVEIRHAMRTKQAKILILDDANGTVRIMNMDGSEQWNYKADITRKLKPSEVVVDFGNGIRGQIEYTTITVRNNGTKQIDKGWVTVYDGLIVIAKFAIDRLIEPTKTLVKDLLEKQEGDAK